MTSPSTRTSSSSPTLMPSSETVSPLTSTRPARISSSAARREHSPAEAMNLWSRSRGGLRSRSLAGRSHARRGHALRAPSPRSPGDSALRPRRRGSASSLDEGLLVRAQLALYDGASNGAKRPNLRDLQIHDRRARSLPPRGLLAWCDLRAPRTLGRLDRSPRWREGFFRLTLPRRDPDPIRQRPRVRAGSSRLGRGSAASPPLLTAFR